MLWFAPLLAALICIAAKPVEVSLEAPWRYPSESVIALETVAQYNASSYFPMLSILISERMKQDGKVSAEDILDNAVASKFLRESAANVAKQEVKLGTSLPFFEFHYQLFEESDEAKAAAAALAFSSSCPVVMWSEGVYSCDRTDLFALQASDSPLTPQLFNNDHVIGGGPQWIVLYADVDSSEFADWHSILLEMALANKVTYVLRYRPPLAPSGSHANAKLAGYGAAFHIKRTDYLVVDDRQLEGELDIDLDAPHQVPSSKLPYLGFSASKEVRGADNSKAQFELLKDISYNFPEHAPRLAQQSSGEADVLAEQQENKIGAFGFNGIFINGRIFKGHELFDFYDMLHDELNMVHTLEETLPSDSDVSYLLTSGIALDDYDDATGEITQPRQRYDLRAGNSAIGWINDIENDILFQSLTDDLDVIQTSKGPFVPLKRNMHSVVVAGDLADANTLKLLKVLLQQSGQQLPIQVGIVSNTPEWQRIAKYGLEARQDFLIQIILGSSFVEAEANVMESVNDSDEAKSSQDEKKLQLSDPYEWMQRFGVEELATKQPVIFVNGVPLTLENWNELSIHIFDNDFKYLKSLDSLDSEPSLRDAIFSTGAPVRNRLLDPLNGAVYSPWPLLSPIHAFKNPEISGSKHEHSVVFSSSFKSPESFDIAEALLNRSAELSDVEVLVRPLAGINKQFYAALFDPMYNTFRFGRDLFSSVRQHFFEHKTAPRVLNAAKAPETPVSQLPVDSDSLIIDGRYIELAGETITSSLLNQLIDRETNRLGRITRAAPGISGLGIAALSAAAQGRTLITDDDKPDILLKNKGGVKVTAIIDPATTEGQLLVALVDQAVEAKLDVSVFLSPSELTEVPTRYFRPAFDRNESVVFKNLVDDVLYTAELIVPSPWMATASKCEYDLDNVILNTVKEDKLEAVYALNGLLVQGFARGKNAPGVALSLLSANGTKMSDTAVMANLGYFQLTAPTPGLYDVCVSSPGHSLVYLSQNVDCISLPVSSYSGAVANFEIQNVPPKQTNRQSPKKSSTWGKVKGLLGKNDKPAADINIFTVASGHLYERFASIMMLSVMKHTKHSVKFWLIENFMSPKFKEFVPELANEYGFDYEFVSYKWPPWLRKQTEKQRQIWAYKMLFLDVLFPQNLSDVIFVDSDQIVRTDFKELLDIDLGKAPYAFTPMGDDREEMEPYRFWKEGFWKRNLLDKGYKYHISALYRVDLDKFRKMKAGDLLRQQYQQLSADPNNLANLDQDLPNSLQTIIPIYSLPQEWLWCETWCSDAGLAWAKTIDLCNNPLTKEPKLERARRQIPEWIKYDDAVAEFAKQVDKKKAEAAATASADAPISENTSYERIDEQDADESYEHDEL